MLSRRLGRIGVAVMVLGLVTAFGCSRAPNDGNTQASTQGDTQTGAQGDTAEQLRNADTDMNAVAGRIEGHLSGDDKQRFVEAEQAWLTYRDTNCDAEKALNDGSVDQPKLEAACLARLTNERRAELLRVYRNNGAD